MTHGKPCVIRHAKANACRHGKPCVHMHVNGEVYKRGGKSVHRGGEEQKGKEGKKKEKKKGEREEKERERREKGNRRSDSRNSSDEEVKSVFSTRATLQEVGFFLLWFIFHHKSCGVVCDAPKFKGPLTNCQLAKIPVDIVYIDTHTV